MVVKALGLSRFYLGEWYSLGCEEDGMVTMYPNIIGLNWYY